jgi:hypothetical protein
MTGVSSLKSRQTMRVGTLSEREAREHEAMSKWCEAKEHQERKKIEEFDHGSD